MPREIQKYMFHCLQASRVTNGMLCGPSAVACPPKVGLCAHQQLPCVNLWQNGSMDRRSHYTVHAHAQGLNIAPALISIAPTKTVVNPTGPLSITDTLVDVTVPALP